MRTKSSETRLDRAAAAEINDLVLQLWIATERSGPAYEDFALTSQQHVLLGLIIAQPQVSAGELADRLGVTKGAISQQLGALEEKNFVARRRSDRDGRVQVIDLGERGIAYRNAVRAYEKHTVEQYLATFTPEDVAQIVAALKKLKTAFD